MWSGLFVPGFELLGRTVLGSAAVSTSILTVPARDMLAIVFRVTGYSGGGDIASLRFGGSAGSVDTAANYWDRHVSVAAGGTTLTNVQTASTTLLRLASATSTIQRSGLVMVSNNATTSKVAQVNIQTSSGAAATIPVLDWGGGEWINTTNQIVSVQMLTAGGTVTMSAGSGFAVFGVNFS